MIEIPTIPRSAKLGLLPLQDRLAIARRPVDESTEGGILLPNMEGQSHSTMNLGVILAAGPDVKDSRIKSGLVDGTTVWVLFLEYAGNELEVGGQTIVTMREDEIHAVVVVDDTPPLEVATEVPGDA